VAWDPESVEWQLRRFGAAFHVRPGFGMWVRTRGHELKRAGAPFRLVLVWDRRVFHAGNVPHGDPYFAIELADGTIERSPWCDD
jgi:hypothetical protein